MLLVYAPMIGSLERCEEVAKSNRCREGPCAHPMKGDGLAESPNLTL